MARGEWVDPAKAAVRLGHYAARWIEERPGLRPRTRQLYRWTLNKHIAPYLGSVTLGRLDTALIREWRRRLLDEGISSGMVAKAYRLLRAVLMTAVKEDQILFRNPCRIPGADKESPDERPTLAIDQVLKLADAVPKRYRAFILTAAFGSLRFGEVTALQRRDVDPNRRLILIRQQYVEVKGEGLVLGPPKSRAGIRSIAVPGFVASALREHIEAYVEPEPAALVFTTEGGVPIRRGSFNKLFRWTDVVADLGFKGLHFHDLRHTGNMLAASSRVSTRDLMARMGHDSMTAALIYQHKSAEADRSIADHMDSQVRRARKTRRKKPKKKPGPDAGEGG
jgi:integrase